MRNPNGYGSIHKIKNRKLRKPYIVRAGAYLDKNGVYKRKIIGYARTLLEAKNLLHNFNTQILNVEFTDITLEDMFNRWINSKNLETINDETRNRNINDFTTTFNTLFKSKFILLKYQDYQNILDETPFTRGGKSLVILRWCYAEARKLEITSNDISKDLKPSKIKTVKVLKTVYDNEIIHKLWNEFYEIENIYYLMLLILFYTGMRANELFKIKNKNINFEKRYFITGSKTKAGIGRNIPIHNKILPLFERVFNENSEYFIDKKYNQVNLRSALDSFLRKNNTKGTLHSIRHTFITRMQQAKVNLSQLKKIVGHTDNSVTNGIYTHWEIKDLLETINKLEY